MSLLPGEDNVILSLSQSLSISYIYEEEIDSGYAWYFFEMSYE